MRKEGLGIRNLILNIFSKNNFLVSKLNVIVYVELNEVIKEMVRLGFGVFFILYILVIDYFNVGKIKCYKIKDVDFIRKFFFIYFKKKIFFLLEDKFLNRLCEYFEIII